MASRKTTWIGLIEVVPREGSDFLGSAEGAFVNVVALASNASDYRESVERAVNELGLDLVDVEDAEPLSNRLKKWTVDEEIRDMAETVKRLGSVAFGTFDTYKNLDETGGD